MLASRVVWYRERKREIPVQRITVTHKEGRERGRERVRNGSPSRREENRKWSFLYQRRILRQGRGTAISLALASRINRPVLGNVSRQRSPRENTPCCRFDVCPG